MKGGTRSPFNTVQRTTTSGHPVDRFSRNTCVVGVTYFTLTFFNFFKLTYHKNHSSLEEAEGGTRGKSLSHILSELSAHRRGFRSQLYLYLLLAVFPTVCIWFAALGVGTMAFNLNEFKFNRSVVDASGRPMLTYNDRSPPE